MILVRLNVITLKKRLLYYYVFKISWKLIANSKTSMPITEVSKKKVVLNKILDIYYLD